MTPVGPIADGAFAAVQAVGQIGTPVLGTAISETQSVIMESMIATSVKLGAIGSAAGAVKDAILDKKPIAQETQFAKA